MGAKAIREQVVTRAMPPWFADPCCGKFEHDRRLTDAENATLSRWAETGASEGKAADAPAAKVWPDGWNLPRVDKVVAMAEEFRVPAKETVDYQYFVIASGAAANMWVRGVELRPKDRSVVHHAGGLCSQGRRHVDGWSHDERYFNGVRSGERTRRISGGIWPS
ncbi:MAG: hypothetical protein WDO18_12375 [Acidobacteriota bacterium]